jgi:aminopeptidase 2
VRAGAPLTPQLELLTRAAADSQRTVLETTIAQLSVLEDVVVADPARPAFRAWAAGLLRPHLTRLGLMPGVAEDSEAQLLRPRLIDALGRLSQDEVVRTEIQERLDRWLSGDLEALPNSLVGVALRIAAQAGDLGRWESFRMRMRDAAAPEEHDRFLAALGSFEASALVRKSLELSLTDEVRAQNLQILLGQLFSNREARRATWAFVVDRWAAVSKKAPVFGLRRVVAATAQLVDAKLRAEVEAFFSDPAHHVEAGERELRQALEAIDLGLGLREREQSNLGEWLRARG